MPQEMTHRERVRAALDGRRWDRPPVSMWRHYFESERSAEALAEAMLAHQARYDWDFMKFNPRASYHAEPWGLNVRYTGNRSPDVVSAPIAEPKDWLRIEPVRLDHPVFQEQLRAVELVGQGLGGRIVYLATVFTPLSIASRLTPSEDLFMRHLRENTSQVDSALKAITETFVAFAKAAIERGAGGLFYATTAFATTSRMTVDEYRKYARPWDLKLIEAVRAPDFHMLHVCRDHNMLPEFRDYPVDAFNWDAHAAGNMGLAEGKVALGGKCVVGGIAQKEGLLAATPDQMRGEVIGLRTAMGTRGWMVGSSCTYSPEIDDALVRAVRKAVDEQAKG
jgi:uroporphyrinogen decarboxylase